MAYDVDDGPFDNDVAEGPDIDEVVAGFSHALASNAATMRTGTARTVGISCIILRDSAWIGPHRWLRRLALQRSARIGGRTASLFGSSASSPTRDRRRERGQHVRTGRHVLSTNYTALKWEWRLAPRMVDGVPVIVHWRKDGDTLTAAFRRPTMVD